MMLKVKHIHHLIQNYHKNPSTKSIEKIKQHLTKSYLSWQQLIERFSGSLYAENFGEGQEKYKQILHIIKQQKEGIELLLKDIHTVIDEQSFSRWEHQFIVQENLLERYSAEDEKIINAFIDKQKNQIQIIKRHLKDIKELENNIKNQEL